MANENSVNNPQAWTFFADRDIMVAETIIDNMNLLGEVLFHSQQAVEKYLKAYLTKNQIRFKKTHDLVELYHIVKGIKDWNIDEMLLKDLRDLYIEIRYPSNIGFLPDGSLPTKEKAESFFNLAKKVASIVKAELE